MSAFFGGMSTSCAHHNYFRISHFPWFVWFLLNLLSICWDLLSDKNLIHIIHRISCRIRWWKGMIPPLIRGFKCGAQHTMDLNMARTRFVWFSLKHPINSDESTSRNVYTKKMCVCVCVRCYAKKGMGGMLLPEVVAFAVKFPNTCFTIDDIYLLFSRWINCDSTSIGWQWSSNKCWLLLKLVQQHEVILLCAISQTCSNTELWHKINVVEIWTDEAQERENQRCYHTWRVSSKFKHPKNMSHDADD